MLSPSPLPYIFQANNVHPSISYPSLPAYVAATACDCVTRLLKKASFDAMGLGDVDDVASSLGWGVCGCGWGGESSIWCDE